MSLTKERVQRLVTSRSANRLLALVASASGLRLNTPLHYCLLTLLRMIVTSYQGESQSFGVLPKFTIRCHPAFYLAVL